MLFWIANISKGFICIGLVILGLCYFLLKDQSPVLIESLESKTVEGNPVFNKIYYKNEKNKDIWLMEQSHQGLNTKPKDWDNIAIVVDKGQKPYKAKFMQLEPNPEKISLSLRPIDLKATCYMCHSNGPRAIRPNFLSEEVRISHWDRARISLWNLKIKAYGPITSSAVEFKKPFKYSHSIVNTKLKVESCTLCHNDTGIFSRNYLTKQNFIAIKFMVENKIMPPPGFKISKEDKEKIEEFMKM